MSINSAYALGALHETEKKEAERSAEQQKVLLKGAEANVEQIELLKQQNKLLSDNYEKIKEMYDSQVESIEESKRQLRKTQKLNVWMLIIAIIAMLAAIAGPITTILVNR